MPRWPELTVEERFHAKVEVLESGCHKWTASLSAKGYGSFKLGGVPMTAHRAAWILAGFEEPVKPLCLDHLCRNRWCVNVAHLVVVTFSENSKRGQLSPARRPDQTKCRKGLHDWVPENLVRTSDGYFTCRPCRVHTRRARYLKLGV